MNDWFYDQYLTREDCVPLENNKYETRFYMQQADLTAQENHGSS